MPGTAHPTYDLKPGKGFLWGASCKTISPIDVPLDRAHEEAVALIVMGSEVERAFLFLDKRQYEPLNHMRSMARKTCALKGCRKSCRHIAQSRPESNTAVPWPKWSHRPPRARANPFMLCLYVMCLAEARARSNAVLRERSLIAMDAKGSNRGREKAFRTSARSHSGTAGGHEGCNLLAPQRNLNSSMFLPIDCPSQKT